MCDGCSGDCSQGRNCNCGEDMPQRGFGVALLVVIVMTLLVVASCTVIVFNVL